MRAQRRSRLTAAEEIELSRRIERGDVDAKNEMIEANLGLVHSVARPYAGRGVAFDDLVQEGTIGLVHAVERFDYRRELRFSTYAVWWIRRAVIDAIGDARVIRMPAGAGRRLAAIQRAEQELRTRGAAAPTAEAISKKAGVSVTSVQALRDSGRVTASLDDQVGGAPVADVVADPHAVDPERELDERETRRLLWSMLGTLPARHRKILVRRYGLDGGEAQTHARIGASLGVGEERSRQLEREALHRLREVGGALRQLAA